MRRVRQGAASLTRRDAAQGDRGGRRETAPLGGPIKTTRRSRARPQRARRADRPTASSRQRQHNRDPTRHEMQPSAAATRRATGACVVLVLIGALSSMLSGQAAIIERAEQRSECDGCGEGCDKCDFGSAISPWCGVRECLKGPGEMCGGPRHKYGICGEGMFCRCNKCFGCSHDNHECYDGSCRHEHHQQLLRHSDLLQELLEK